MRPLITLLTATAIALSAVPASHAQTRSNPDCPRSEVNCQSKGAKPQNGHKGKPGQTNGGHAQKPQQGSKIAHAAPKKGDSGRGGQAFNRASNSRFKAPPRGQEYRVVNEHLVLMDSKTLQIVTVLGLLSTLLK